jgi:FMN-dependent NADH-azoreductase
MPTLLHIDASPLGDASISRHLSHQFVQKWQALNPTGKVIARDLTTTAISPINGSWIGAVYTPEASRTPEQQEILKLSETLIAELESADEYAIGIPMHNFGIPSTFKLWIDQIVRAGKTFVYIDGKPNGLLKNKKATFLIASGGTYDAGTVMASFNFVEPYLRTIFGFVGVTDTTSINAGGTAALNYGQIDRQAFLQPHIDSINLQLQPA